MPLIIIFKRYLNQELKKKDLEKKIIRKWGMIFQYMNNINIII
jgi:hypothetical protein